jgi:hypothetical protein
MRRWIPFLALVITLVSALPVAAQVQTPELTLNLHRNFGFSAGGQIQGAFTLTAIGPDDLARVDFSIDGQTVHSATRAPFAYSFSTGDYSLGPHSLAATGLTASGTRLASAARTVEFVRPEVGLQVAGKLALPLLGVVLVITLFGTLGPILLGRKQGAFQPGVYGAEGGAVCPRCSLPFPRHFFSMNLLTGKFERCPHCGKWSLVGRASAAALAQAEARLQEENNRGRLAEPPAAEALRQMVDDSRYEDG